MKISANNSVGKNSLFMKALDLIRDKDAISGRITKVGEKTLSNATDILNETRDTVKKTVKDNGIKGSAFDDKRKEVGNIIGDAMGDDFAKLPKWRKEAMQNDVTSAIFNGDEEVSKIFSKGEGFSSEKVREFAKNTDKQYQQAEKSMARGQAAKEYFTGGENGREMKNYVRTGVGGVAGIQLTRGLLFSKNEE